MENYIGIDISKRYFDLHCLPEGKQHQFENNQKGIQQCLKLLADIKPKLAVMESTGGYEITLACKLQATGLLVAVVNPNDRYVILPRLSARLPRQTRLMRR